MSKVKEDFHNPSNKQHNICFLLLTFFKFTYDLNVLMCYLQKKIIPFFLNSKSFHNSYYFQNKGNLFYIENFERIFYKHSEVTCMKRWPIV